MTDSRYLVHVGAQAEIADHPRLVHRCRLVAMPLSLSLLLLLLLPLLVLASGCRQTRTVVDGQVTGIKLTVRYNPQLQLTALAISGTVNGAPAFTPGTLPSPPRRLTSGQESASILVPSALAGSSVVVRVDGKAGATVMGSQQQAITVRASTLVSVSMTLGERAVCGDGVQRPPIETCDDGNTVPGDGCSASCEKEGGGSCDAASCPNGCCANGFCQVVALATCGVGGAVCAACDPLAADQCSSAGVCACGTGAPCAAGQF